VIVRVLRARVPPAAVGKFNRLLREQLDDVRDQPGLVYVKLARRLTDDNGEEVVLFEEWRTPSDLWTWTGGSLARPRLLPGAEDLVEELVIDHYEALDVVPDLAFTVIDGTMAEASKGEPASNGPPRGYRAAAGSARFPGSGA
jgi:heme-degrading monooxygenase HmoA